MEEMEHEEVDTPIFAECRHGGDSRRKSHKSGENCLSLYKSRKYWVFPCFQMEEALDTSVKMDDYLK